MSLPKRDSVILELRRRLLAGLGKIPIIEGNGGIWGAWDRNIPCIHIYEMPTSKDLPKPGKYQVELPVQIEYVNKLVSQTSVYTEGRTKLAQLSKVIELDERFTENFSLPTQGQDLVSSFSCVADEIMSPLPGVVDVGVIYVFKYTEVFHGYEQKRH